MDETIKFLYSLGHQYNPPIRHMFDGMEAKDWENLKLHEEPARALVASYQSTMYLEHRENVKRVYGNNVQAQFDGLVGEATIRTLRTLRCGCHDYVDDSLAIGSGGWGVCTPQEWPRNNGYYYYLDSKGMNSTYESMWPAALKTVVDAYAELGFAVVETKDKSKANSIWSVDLRRSGIIGLASIPSRDGAANCSRGYFLKCDPTYYPTERLLATLWAHELGHNVLSGHITGDPVMHPGIRSGWNGSFRNTTFGNRLVAWYGGEPLERKVPPPNNPTPPTTDPFKDTYVHFQVGDALYSKYIMKYVEEA